VSPGRNTGMSVRSEAASIESSVCMVVKSLFVGVPQEAQTELGGVSTVP
jgi:hypothetical protein